MMSKPAIVGRYWESKGRGLYTRAARMSGGRCRRGCSHAPAEGSPVSQKNSCGYWSYASNRNLGSNFDHAPGGDLEEVGGVARRLGKPDEQPILPARHAGMGSRLER